jgi:hypothetical protein
MTNIVNSLVSTLEMQCTLLVAQTELLNIIWISLCELCKGFVGSSSTVT